MVVLPGNTAPVGRGNRYTVAAGHVRIACRVHVPVALGPPELNSLGLEAEGYGSVRRARCARPDGERTTASLKACGGEIID